MDSVSSGKSGYTSERTHAGTTLTDAAKEWPTPQAHDAAGGKTPEQVAAMRERTGAGVSNLNEVAESWLTPRVSDTNGAGPHGDGGLDLRTKAELWSTPTQADVTGGRKARSGDRSGDRSGELLLNGQAAMWATPTASLTNDGEEPATFEARQERLKEQGINGNGAGTPLTIQSKQWATPEANLIGDGEDPEAFASRKKKTRERYRKVEAAPAGEPLTIQAQKVAQSGPPDHPIEKVGGDTSQRVVLNPSFVEALMGFPIGWTVCAASATP